MYYTSATKQNNEKFLKSVKSLFGLCDNVKIVLVGSDIKNELPFSQSYILHLTSFLHQDVQMMQMNGSLLHEVCKHMGFRMKRELLSVCKNHFNVFSKSIRAEIMLDQYNRCEGQIGLIGNLETYHNLLQRLSKIEYNRGQYYYNCPRLNCDSIAIVEGEHELYMIKGHPTFYLRTRVFRNKFDQIEFKFFLDKSNLEIYKL